MKRAMESLQLCEHSRTRTMGVVFVHARLKARRGDSWHTVGVFQLTEDEWLGLSELVGECGITVTHADEPVSA